MQTVQMNLARLQRHYEATVRTYDYISLVDLSHTLRVWADLKLTLPSLYPSFGTTKSFTSARPSPKLCKAIRGREFVIACFPGRVTTYGGNALMSMGITPHADPTRQKIVRSSFKPTGDGGAEIGSYRSTDMEVETKFGNPEDGEIKSRLNFAEWLGAEAVRVSYPDKSGKLKFEQLSRDTIIRRVANTRDGSHPSAAQSLDNVDNRYDPAIDYLFNEELGELPLPYLILLKIAQEIVTNAPKLMQACNPA